MIQAIPAILYISLLCFLAGSALAPVLLKEKFGFVTACFVGLATLGTLLTIASFFIPVGGIAVQLGVAALSLTAFLFRRHKIPRLSNPLADWTKPAVCLFVVLLILVIVLFAAPVNHPDTLIYHAAQIRLAEQYPAIPGIANLQYHYGLQSSMFISSAFFSYRFTGTSAITFLNLTIAVWLLLFVIGQLNQYLRTDYTGSRWPAVAWLLLIITCFWSSTMLRLSVTSASIDFIATMYCWLSFFLFFRGGKENVTLYPVLLLSLFTVSIKFSAAPLLLLPAAMVLGQRPVSVKTILISVCAALFVLGPIIGRNYIASGYPLFPVNFLGTGADWQVPEGEVSLGLTYIRTYARLQVEFDPALIYSANAMPVQEWLPQWFRSLQSADKTILITLVLLVFWLVFNLKQLAASNLRSRIILVLSFAGCLAWFIQAPDPRFGYGFLIPFIAISLDVIPLTPPVRMRQGMLSSIAIAFAMLAAAFIVYRIYHFTNAHQVLRPSGALVNKWKSINCSGIPFNTSIEHNDCADLPAPCIKGCDGVNPRGTFITDGFKP